MMRGCVGIIALISGGVAVAGQGVGQDALSVPTEQKAPPPAASGNPTVLSHDAPLSGSELVALAERIRLFRPKSMFDAAPVRDLTGKRFAIDLPTRPGGSGGCLSMPWWRYSPDRQELELVFYGGHRGQMKDRKGKMHPVFTDYGLDQVAPIRCQKKSQGYYQVQNAFGARISIERVSESDVEISVPHDFAHLSRIDFITQTLKMTPKEAQSVVPRLRVHYEGFLHHWSTGTSVACGIQHDTVDMTAIWDTTVDTCIFRGFVDHVAFVDSGTGKILAEKSFARPADKWL